LQSLERRVRLGDLRVDFGESLRVTCRACGHASPSPIRDTPGSRGPHDQARAPGRAPSCGRRTSSLREAFAGKVPWLPARRGERSAASFPLYVFANEAVRQLRRRGYRAASKTATPNGNARASPSPPAGNCARRQDRPGARALRR
jgi:hypothetical protein